MRHRPTPAGPDVPTITRRRISAAIPVALLAFAACAGSGGGADGPLACSTRACFQDQFDRCQPARYTTSEGGFTGARVRYEILMPAGDQCRVSLVYEANPNTEWVDKELRFIVPSDGAFIDRVMEGMGACMNEAGEAYECGGSLLPVLQGAGASGPVPARAGREARRQRAEEAARARAALPERIAFMTSRAWSGSRHSVFAVSPGADSLGPIAAGVVDESSAPAWSPSGERVALGQYSEIVLVPTDGSEPTTIDLDGPADCSDVRDVDFAPDGGRIAFSAGCPGIETGSTGYRWHIFIVDVESGDVRVVPTFPDDYNYEPAWSPEGERIAFAAVRELESGGFESDVYVVGIDGTDLRPLTGGERDPAGQGAVDRHPAWSPDGSRIAFTSWRGGTPDIWVMDVETGESHQVTSGPERDEYPTWSRDGSRIAYTSRGEELYSSAIWVVSAEGGEATRLTESGHWDRQPAWR